MAYLVLSIVILGAGPLVFRLVRERQVALSALDGFIFTSILGLTLFILPEAAEHGGLWVLLFVVLGLLGPTILERNFHRVGRETHLGALILGLFGLCLHALADGVALSSGSAGVAAAANGGSAAVGSSLAHSHLPLAIVLHRFPVGLTVWWLLRPTYGSRAAVTILVFMTSATLAGFFFGESLAGALTTETTAWFQAFVAGSLLHVVVHRPHSRSTCCGGHSGAAPDPSAGLLQRRWGGFGGVLGIGMIIAIWWAQAHFAGLESHAHEAAGGEAGARIAQTFLALALESAPPLLLGYLIAGLMSGFLPRSSVEWMRRGGPGRQALRGMALGLPFPVCSCGVVPLYRTLIQRGAPPAAAFAFLVATPELGLDAVLLSFPLLGSEMAVLRVAAAALLAFAVGRFVGVAASGAAGELPEIKSCCVGKSVAIVDGHATAGARLKAGLKTSLVDVFDSTAPWILLGLAIAAVIAPLLEGERLAGVPWLLEVPLFALIGVPTYVCASGATPLVAVLLAGGMSPGAAIAFLLTGPATNVTTFGVIAGLHGRRTALLFSVTMAGGAIAIGYAINLILPGVDGGRVAHLHAHDAPLWRWLCLAVLGVLCLSSILRAGPREFAGKVLPS